MRLSFKLAILFFTASMLLYGFGENSSLESSVPETPVVAGQTTKIANLPKKIKESSGLEEADQPGTFYTHNDANNPAELFKIDQNGKLLATISLAPIENVDWEDLARDDKGHIYIADTGNNSNKRKKLKIYKLNPEQPEEVAEITFEYADRKAGTADKDHFEFDCEAIFWYRSNLYLTIKDRNDGLARLYKVPDQPGDHEAKPIGSYRVNAPITAADISPDGTTLLLLSTGKLHLFRPEGERKMLGGKMQTLDLGKVGQTEAAVFTDNKTIVLTSEQGNMYRYKL